MTVDRTKFPRIDSGTTILLCRGPKDATWMVQSTNHNHNQNHQKKKSIIRIHHPTEILHDMKKHDLDSHREEYIPLLECRAAHDRDLGEEDTKQVEQNQTWI